jgi:rubrerythrin
MKNTFFVLTFLAISFISCKNSTTEAVVENKDSVKPVLKTLENLMYAFKGETTASAKYAAFATKAKEEGQNEIAKLFEAASKSESIHAANHAKVIEEMGGKTEAFTPEFEVKTTAENLQAAYDGETEEITNMYPGFITTSETEKVDNAVQTFTYAIETEKKHQAFYQKAIEALKNKKTKELAFEFYVCPKCGNTYDKNNVKDFCELCATPKDKFNVIK